jgi:hypothetical protein
VTVANNSAYDNYLDPGNNGTWRPQIGANTGADNVFINNIAYGVVGAGYLACNDGFLAGGTGKEGTFDNNVSYVAGKSCNGDNPMFNGNAFSCSSNKCAADPSWTAVGSNFALQSNSPAIGYGQLKSYLPAQAVDVGACHHSLGTCP